MNTKALPIKESDGVLHKKCADCRLFKPFSAFYIYKSTGRPTSQCRECISLQRKKKTNPRRIAPIGTVGFTSNGYIKIKLPDHPNSFGGWVTEHVKVMSEMINRPLMSGENVHHINGDKTDNRPENLELWTTSQPTGQRVSDKIEWAKDFLEQHGYTVVEHLS